MATNLAGSVCIGELNACVLRVARLNADCSPAGGTNGGVVTAGLVTLTADPDIQEGTVFEQLNGCGDLLFTYEQKDRIKRYNISGEVALADFELMALMFGGDVILGKAGGDFAGKVIGYADPLYSAPPSNGVYLEVITTVIEQGAGSCVASDGSVPVAMGHVFGKAQLVPGQLQFANAVKLLSFSGKSTNNPNLFNGPWNDYPGAGYTKNTAHLAVGYTQAEYDAILDVVGCGYVDLPAGS